MPSVWNAFIEDYKDHLHEWSLKFTLEAFWHYCQGGSRECNELLGNKNIDGIYWTTNVIPE